MHRKIIYLINPVSGVKAKSTVHDLIIKRTREKKIDFDIIYTNQKGEYDFLKQKIVADKITDVVICGGDGTVNAIASALLGTSVRIGIIPVGSGNGLAFSAKLPRQAGKALDIIFSGHASFIDGFYINRDFSCMLCGIGFDALVAHEFAKQKTRGLQTYIRVSLTNFFKAKPYDFEIQHHQKSFPANAFLITVSNSNQFGNNFTIAPKASLNDGLLDVVIVKKMNKFALPFFMLRQITGINGVQDLDKGIAKKNILYFQTPELIIHNRSMAPLHVDGEPRGTSESFTIKVVSRAINLIQPAI
jgi:diacylglycerol kinase (ATP)